MKWLTALAAVHFKWWLSILVVFFEPFYYQKSLCMLSALTFINHSKVDQSIDIYSDIYSKIWILINRYLWGFHGGDYEEWCLLGCCTARCEEIVFLRSLRRLLVTASVVPSSPILVTLTKEALSSSETPVLTRATWRNIPEDTILNRYLANKGADWNLGPCLHFLLTGGKDNTVSRATDYRLESQEVKKLEFKSHESQECSLLHSVQTSPGTHPASYAMGTRDSLARSTAAKLRNWTLTSNWYWIQANMHLYSHSTISIHK
jgi:hypothetical protein